MIVSAATGFFRRDISRMLDFLKARPRHVVAPRAADPRRRTGPHRTDGRELTRCEESVHGVRVGPCKPAAEFLDIEDVRLRIAQEQGGQLLPSQANLVERLRALPPEQPITYVILETATRQAKCYVDAEGHQLRGVLWLPAVIRAGEESGT